MRLRLVTLVLWILSISFQMKAQDQIVGDSISQTIIKDVKNELSGRSYQLIITLPVGYNSEKTYKVLYYLDAFWLSDIVKGSYRINSLTSDMDEMILVGISSVGGEYEWNLQRSLDFTPSAYDIDKMKISMDAGGIELNETTTGDCKEFMAFLEKDVLKKIEEEYHIDQNARSILGHSFGGLFGFYAFVNRNELFQNYILISPSIWWNKSELLMDLDTTKPLKDSRIFIAMGGVEFPMLKNPIRSFEEYMATTEKDHIQVSVTEYDNLNHHSVVPIGIYHAFEQLFSKE